MRSVALWLLWFFVQVMLAVLAMRLADVLISQVFGGRTRQLSSRAILLLPQVGRSHRGNFSSI